MTSSAAVNAVTLGEVLAMQDNEIDEGLKKLGDALKSGKEVHVCDQLYRDLKNVVRQKTYIEDKGKAVIAASFDPKKAK